MLKRTYKVTLPDGRVETRTTETKHYTHAVVTEAGVIRWSESQANAAKYAASSWPASRGARVVEVDAGGPEAPAPRITAIGLDPAGQTCTIGPNAVTGERCGRPAVTGFTNSRGERFYECADHAPRGVR